jgi:hypothetical protein
MHKVTLGLSILLAACGPAETSGAGHAVADKLAPPVCHAPFYDPQAAAEVGDGRCEGVATAAGLRCLPARRWKSWNTLRDVGYGVYYPVEPEQPEPPLYIEAAWAGSDGDWHTRYTLLVRDAEKICEDGSGGRRCKWRIPGDFWSLVVPLACWRLCSEEAEPSRAAPSLAE